MQQVAKQPFDWAGELHKTVVQSLTTSFGLDFLLFDDKVGGNVDTIHNARKGVYATQNAKQNYENRGEYNSHQYHSHKDYIAHGKRDKNAQQSGNLTDNYRNQTMKMGEKRQLDHTISASEIHHDAGRVLAGLDGVALANQETNLNSTHWYINNIKRDHSAEKFINEIAPKNRDNLQRDIQKDKQKLANMPTKTPQQRHEKRELESKIAKNNEKLDALNTAIQNKQAILKADKVARENYNKQINVAYYTSNTFLKNTAKSAVNSGFKMGLRQSIGMILAELWFELKSALPRIFQQCKVNFNLGNFLGEIKQTLVNIWERLKLRFKDVFAEFKNGMLAGVLSEITTTIINIFFTTQKNVVKIIRETYQSVVKAVKLIFFNPERLDLGDLTKEVTRLLSTGVSIAVGVIVNTHLNALMSAIPFGLEISAFISALATGVLTVGFSYFLDYSPMMQKVWDFLNRFKSKYKQITNHYKEINAELDRYVAELAKLEFNMNPDELRYLADSLEVANDEYAKGLILAKEVEKRNIDLPFEANNLDSVRDWLIGLQNKS